MTPTDLLTEIAARGKADGGSFAKFAGPHHWQGWTFASDDRMAILLRGNLDGYAAARPA